MRRRVFIVLFVLALAAWVGTNSLWIHPLSSPLVSSRFGDRLIRVHTNRADVVVGVISPWPNDPELTRFVATRGIYFQGPQVVTDRPLPGITRLKGPGLVAPITSAKPFPANLLMLTLSWLWLEIPTTALVLAMTSRFMFLRLRRRQRAAENLCPTCGYDLRATPERCPECGTISPQL